MSFWLLTVGIPLGLYILNMWVRLYFHAPITASSDWALLLLALDFTVLASPGDFTRHISNPDLSQAVSPIFVMLVIGGIMVWLFNVLHLEPALERVRTSGWPMRTLAKGILSMALIVGYTYAHLYIFTAHP